VPLVRTDVSEELRASFLKVTRIGELGTTLAVTSNRRTLRVKNNRGKVVLKAFLDVQDLAQCKFIPEGRTLNKCMWTTSVVSGMQ
jgi:hypothetical protein